MFDWDVVKVWGTGILLVVVILAISIAVGTHDAKVWKQYSDEHHCRVAGHIAASSSLGMTSSGKSAVVFNDAKTIYHCDNDDEEIR